MSVRAGLAAALALGLVACAAMAGEAPDLAARETLSPEQTRPVTSASPESAASATPLALLEPESVVDTGDVADWPGDWSPDGRFYVFFRWSADAPCSGESVYAYDTKLRREIWISSGDYCTREVDPNMIWEGDSTLIFGDGPDGSRWGAVTLGDEVERTPLDEAPPSCVDRDIPLPLALDGLTVSRARWSPDKSLLAVAVVPDDEAHRFDGIPGNRPDLHLFQRLDIAVFPARVEGADQGDLRWLGPIFDWGPDGLGPDGGSGEDCPGTQLRWSGDGHNIISSLGPFVYEVESGGALLAPDGPNSGPLGPNVRWSPDDWLVADERILLDLRSGEQYPLPGILPGYDRGFAGPERFVYVTEMGLSEYDIASQSVRQLTDFRLAVFVVAPDGTHLVYADGGDLWVIRLAE